MFSRGRKTGDECGTVGFPLTQARSNKQVIKTWLIYGILLAFELKAPHLFYRSVAIIGYAISIIFWLSAWAWAASNAGFWLGYVCAFGVCDDGPWKSEGAALAVSAALGAIVW